jgi:hypothetical protein
MRPGFGPGFFLDRRSHAARSIPRVNDCDAGAGDVPYVAGQEHEPAHDSGGGQQASHDRQMRVGAEPAQQPAIS